MLIALCIKITSPAHNFNRSIWDFLFTFAFSRNSQPLSEVKTFSSIFFNAKNFAINKNLLLARPAVSATRTADLLCCTNKLSTPV